VQQKSWQLSDKLGLNFVKKILNLNSNTKLQKYKTFKEGTDTFSKKYLEKFVFYLMKKLLI